MDHDDQYGPNVKSNLESDFAAKLNLNNCLQIDHLPINCMKIWTHVKLSYMATALREIYKRFFFYRDTEGCRVTMATANVIFHVT